MMHSLAIRPQPAEPSAALVPCEHRSVSNDGRIVCKKIVEGENLVTADVCRACPYKAVNCRHLRFTLRQITPSPLIVRYNGRTEVWGDDPQCVELERAACAARVVPLEGISVCAGCALRQPAEGSGGCVPPRQRRAALPGKVVPFPGRAAAAATG